MSQHIRAREATITMTINGRTLTRPLESVSDLGHGNYALDLASSDRLDTVVEDLYGITRKEDNPLIDKPRYVVVRVRHVVHPTAPIAVIYAAATAKSIEETGQWIADRLNDGQTNPSELKWRQCQELTAEADLDRPCIVDARYVQQYVPVRRQDVIPGRQFAPCISQHAAIDTAQMLSKAEIDPEKYIWLCVSGEHQDRWCVVRIQDVEVKNIPIRTVCNEPRASWLTESEKWKMSRVAATDQDRWITDLEKAAKNYGAPKPAKPSWAEARPRKTIDVLIAEMEAAMSRADDLPHPPPSVDYQPHFVITDKHRAAWKARLAVKIHENKIREQNRVLVDREYEDWE